jgi:hypothetical protein
MPQKPDPDQKLRERLGKLFAMLGSSNEGERETARLKIDALLERNHKNWNDLTEYLKTGKRSQDWKYDDGETTNKAPVYADGQEIPNIFDLIFYPLQHYLHFKTLHELVAITLWILHTFIFDRFTVTPRLALLSPVRECGKTTVMTALNRLVYRPECYDDTSAAVLYQTIDFAQPTLLVDEADNLPLNKPGPLRSVFNSGHHQNGSVGRVVGGRRRRFATFSPMAIAAIGRLPLPLLARAIVINMERAPRNADLKRLDLKNADQMRDFDNIHWYIYQWARQCQLYLDPPMPKALRNRRADNWRPLFAIADACDRGELARKAAVALSRQHQDEDAAVELLADVRQVFDARNVDRLASADVISDLHDLDDGRWTEWLGIHDNQHPHRLSQSELSSLLRSFEITPRSLWPIGPRTGARSRRGYYRHQFEAAWRAYVDLHDEDEENAEQPSKIRPLRLA